MRSDGAMLAPGEDGGVSEFRSIAAPHTDDSQASPTTPYGWRGGGVALLGDYRDDRWTIARGWLAGDAMTDVRRWTFAAPSAFAGQVRRLVLDATGDGALARARGAEALLWASAVAERQVA